MDPIEPPALSKSPEESASQTALESDPAALDGHWLHRTFLGLSGVAIAQALLLFQEAATLLLLFSTRAGATAAENVFKWMPHVDQIAMAILWFSALYLLAAPGRFFEGTSLSTPRKLLLIFAGGSLVARAFPWLVFPSRSQQYLSSILPVLHLAAMGALLYYLFKFAQRVGDEYARRHVPLVFVLIVLAQGLAISVQLDLVRAEDILLVLRIATTVYFLHLIMHMRGILGERVFTQSPTKAEHAN